jgi:hypothetical protein
MDMSIVNEIITTMSGYVEKANSVPGSFAFLAGMFAWFLVEQFIRKIADIVRVLIIGGVIAASGVSIVALTAFLTTQ